MATETFVYNQITSLSRYRPVLVHHHRRAETHFPVSDVAVAHDRLPASLAWLDSLAYRMGRIALPAGTGALAQYLRAEGAQVLHYHYATDARFLVGLKRRTGLPAIVSAYGYDVSGFPELWGGLGRRYLRPIFDRLDCFLAMSDDMRRDLLGLGCPEAKIRVHYHGSNTQRFRYPQRVYEKDGPLTILCCARLEPRKAQHIILHALRRIERRHRDDFRLVFIGDGVMRQELEQLIADYGWTDRVTFTGHIPHTSDELVEWYRRADIFALPSITADGLKEGIPGTLVEAMASGLPVISSRHAGIPYVVESGEHGILVPEHDVAALATAFEALLADATLREQLGRAAAERAARELDLRVRTRALERIYDQFV
jgi:colanic acid/amylovoran biosynthesis glycosyltransferase